MTIQINSKTAGTYDTFIGASYAPVSGGEGFSNVVGATEPYIADLNLDFVTNNTLDQRLSYTSRGSNAMQYDSQGRLVWAPANMLTYSQDFSNAAWSKGAVTVTANVAVAPGGATAADLVYPTSSGLRYIYAAASVISGAPYTVSIYLKAAGLTWVHLSSINGSVAKAAWFNLSTGVIGTIAGGVTAAIYPIGNGWFRCSVTDTTTSTTGNLQLVAADADNSTNVTASGTSGYYLWGAQLELRGIDSPKPYNATTSAAYYAPRLDYDPGTLQPKGLFLEEAGTNLLTWSTNLDTATGGWTNLDTTVSSTSVIGPDGFPCQLLTEGTLGTAAHSKSGTIVAFSDFVCFSVYAKMASTSFPWIRLLCYDGTNGFQAWFNLQLGTVGTVGLFGVGGTATAGYIESVGNGWYRCVVVGKIVAGVTATVLTSSASADNSVTRINNATRYEFGPQLESVSAAATRWASSYIPTYSATGTRAADNSPYMASAGWFSQAAGTAVCEYSHPTIPSAAYFPTIFALNDNTTTNQIKLFSNVGGSGLTAGPSIRCDASGNANYVNVAGGSIQVWQTKVALAWAATDYAIYGSLGGSATSAAGGATPFASINRLSFGVDGAVGNVTGSRWIKSFKYYARRRPNAELQALADLTQTPQVDLGFLSYGQNQGLLDRRLTWTDRASNATMFDSQGRLVYAPANMVVGSDAPAGQSITVASGQSYTVSLYGTASDSITLSNAYAGTLAGTGLSNRVSLTFTAASGTLTLAKTNSPVYVQVEPTGVDSPKPYIRTETAAVYQPRIDYDPATKTCLGLLLEEARTNLLTYSDQFDNAAWTKLQATITANTNIAPDGTLTGDKLVEDSANNLHGFRHGAIAAGTYTLSVYAKAAERSRISVGTYYGSTISTGFDLSNGTTFAVTGANVPTSSSISSVGNGWYRCSITFTIASTDYPLFCVLTGSSLGYTGDGTSGIYVWGAQLEAGAFPTSYIPTYASTATRNADYAPYMPLPYSPNAHLGTYVTNAMQKSIGTTSFRLSSASDGTTQNRMFNDIYIDKTLDGGGTVAGINGFSAADSANQITLGTGFRASGMWTGTPNVKLCLNGGTVVTTTISASGYPSTNLPVFTTGNLYPTVVTGQGWYSRARRYHNFAFSDAQLQGLV